MSQQISATPGMLELRRKVLHEGVESRLLRHDSLKRTAEDRPCETSIHKAHPVATALTGAEKCDIPRVGSWLTLRADSLQLISHGRKVKSTSRGKRR